jgi:exodeoxyribonuclease III
MDRPDAVAAAVAPPDVDGKLSSPNKDGKRSSPDMDGKLSSRPDKDGKRSSPDMDVKKDGAHQTTLDGWMKTPTLVKAGSAEAVGWRIVSWNANGLTEAAVAWLRDYVARERPAVMCLNETQRPAADVERLLKTDGYHLLVNAHDPARWHGVAVMVRNDVKFARIDARLACKPRSDNKSGDAARGRVIALHLPDIGCRLVATYSPNSGRAGKNLAYRIDEWDRALFAFLEAQRCLGPALWIGDINVAPEPIDVTQPGSMASWAGFTPRERTSLAAFVKTGGWVDVWRANHLNAKQYSWHGESGRSGMRLDNAYCSRDLMHRVREPFISPNGTAPSDHQPLGVTLLSTQNTS